MAISAWISLLVSTTALWMTPGQFAFVNWDELWTMKRGSAVAQIPQLRLLGKNEIGASCRCHSPLPVLD